MYWLREGWELEISCSRGGCLRQAKLCSFSKVRFLFFFLMVSISSCISLIIWTAGLHLAPLLCTHPRPCLLPLDLCRGPKLPWATSTPTHVHGTVFYFSVSGTQGGNYTFVLQTHFLNVYTLVFLCMCWAAGGGISTSAQVLLITGSSFYLLYVVEKCSTKFGGLVRGMSDH